MNTEPGFLDDINSLQGHIQRELNVIDVNYSSDAGKIVLSAALNFKVLGKQLGKDMKKVQQAAKQLTQEELTEFEKAGHILLCGHTITSEGMSLTRSVSDLNSPHLETSSDPESVVIMDFAVDEDLSQMALGRDVANRIQRLRKDAKLEQDAAVDIWVSVMSGNAAGSGALARALDRKRSYIEGQTRKRLWDEELRQGHEALIRTEELEVKDSGGDRLLVTITQRGPFFNPSALATLTGGDSALEAICRTTLQTRSVEDLSCGDGTFQVSHGDHVHVLQRGVHFSVGPEEAPWLRKESPRACHHDSP